MINIANKDTISCLHNSFLLQLCPVSNIPYKSIFKMAAKEILVTCGNSGIGFALCKLLIRDHNCHVYLGSRSLEKGKLAVETIRQEVSSKAERIEVVQIDVGNDDSCKKASKSLANLGVKLFALVNNAWVMQTSDTNLVINTNYYGSKRVTKAMVDLIDPKGRIFYVSSDAATMWLKLQDDRTKRLLSNPEATFEELDKAVKENVNAKNFQIVG